MSGRSDIELRPAVPSDAPFLRRLYGSSRPELSLVALSADQLEAILEMQFRAREGTYSEQFPAADNLAVLLGGQPAGRLYVERARKEVRIVDIALLPEYRGSGIGSALIAALQEEAAAAGVPVVLHVETGNPAANLYRRLGFAIEASDGVYDAMRWLPQPVVAGSGR